METASSTIGCEALICHPQEHSATYLCIRVNSSWVVGEDGKREFYSFHPILHHPVLPCLVFCGLGGGFLPCTSPDCSCISYKTLASVIPPVPFPWFSTSSDLTAIKTLQANTHIISASADFTDRSLNSLLPYLWICRT